MRIRFSIIVLAAFVFAFTSSGCKRENVKVYQVSKEQPASSQSEMSATMSGENVSPQLQFILPANWQEKAPSQMRAASFTATGANGETADIGVIPLPKGEDDLALVNMWRQQMQLPPLTNESSVETVSIGNASAKLFDIASEAPLIDGKFRARILVAELTRGTTSWFFKMTGEDKFVASQKENFRQFLKSVSFVENPVAQNSSRQADVENQSADSKLNSIWTIPPDWKPVPPSSSILLAQFLVQASDAQAEVNVAEFPGNAGGSLANINRWRGQLGLQPLTSDNFSSSVSEFEVSNGKAQIVDFTGTDSKTGKPSRLVGAVVPEDGQTWFYKLMGDPQIVAQQKDAFLKFIQSAKYPDARNAP